MCVSLAGCSVPTRQKAGTKNLLLVCGREILRSVFRYVAEVAACSHAIDIGVFIKVA